MPRPKKKHGHRMEQAVKEDQPDRTEPQQRTKRRKLDDESEYVTGADQDPSYAEFGPTKSITFYGLLNDEEQEYFTKADGILELDQFDSAEGMMFLCCRCTRDADGVLDRALFVANVWREASGKQLKIACSQSCSRLMERLVYLSSPSQLKDLFQAFNGQ